MLRFTLILPLLFAMLVRTAAAQTQVAAVPFIQWEKFVDPNEGSFWMEVPSGWRISGGLARRNALQFWPWLTAVSPDGDTIIAFGDPNLQSYVLPTPSLAAAGFHEGSLYSGGGGTLYVVRRYARAGFREGLWPATTAALLHGSSGDRQPRAPRRGGLDRRQVQPDDGRRGAVQLPQGRHGDGSL
jgi:hypothetical protein